MPDSQIYTVEAAVKKASVIQASLATGKLRLFADPFTPTVNTTKAQMVAAEIAADGYPAGGYPILAFSDPLGFPGGGAVITSPMVEISYGPAGVPPVGASVSGGWVEDTDADVRVVFTYSPARALSAALDGWQEIVQFVEGRNATSSPS